MADGGSFGVIGNYCLITSLPKMNSKSFWKMLWFFWKFLYILSCFDLVSFRVDIRSLFWGVAPKNKGKLHLKHHGVDVPGSLVGTELEKHTPRVFFRNGIPFIVIQLTRGIACQPRIAATYLHKSNVTVDGWNPARKTAEVGSLSMFIPLFSGF